MRYVIFVVALIAVVGGVLLGTSYRASSLSATNSPTPGHPSQSPDPRTDDYNIDSASSLTVVVNKRRPLSPANYVPADLVRLSEPQGGTGGMQLRRPAAQALGALFRKFQQETGHQMEVESAYRSFKTQRLTYDSIRSSYGATTAAESAALPGYSEHQTGLAVDIGQLDSSCRARDCFAATPAGQWLRSHAWQFGFIIRFPAGQSGVTGYEYEPWHLRYLGNRLAKKVHFHASSLEQFFGLPAAPNYNR